MRAKKTLLLAGGFALMFTLVGCGREDRAEAARGTDDAAFTQQRDEYVNRMETQIAEMERNLNEMRQRAQAQDRVRIDEVERQLNELRQEVSDLRTASPDTWWEHRQRSTDRTLGQTGETTGQTMEPRRGAPGIDMDRDRTGTAGTTAREGDRAGLTGQDHDRTGTGIAGQDHDRTGTGIAGQDRDRTGIDATTGQDHAQAGTTTHGATGTGDFTQERDEYINRLEMQVREMEQNINQARADARTQERREHLNRMERQVERLREEIEDLRQTTADNWWDRTQQRLDRRYEGIEHDMRGMGGRAGDRAETSPQTRQEGGQTGYGAGSGQQQQDRQN